MDARARDQRGPLYRAATPPANGEVVDDADAQPAAGAAAGPDFDDRLSWEDSERFDGDDSLCSSPYSEAESMCQNWRGWSAAAAAPPLTPAAHSANDRGPVAASMGVAATAPPLSSLTTPSYTCGLMLTPAAATTMAPVSGSALSSAPISPTGYGARAESPDRLGASILSLVELTAKRVALDIPFEVVERFHLPVPENLQLRIAFWSFPGNEEEVRLYSCLANGNVDEFNKGQALFDGGAVEDLLQIGFHLSGIVITWPQSSVQSSSRNNSHSVLLPQTLALPMSSSNTLVSGTMPTPKKHNVAVTLDRRKITSCTCTCNPNVSWCAHVVALCLHRIHKPSTVSFRAPLSESLSRLEKEQLQKFSQYLISELPRYFLPTAQKLLDALLSQNGTINVLRGAPDPTAGASLNDVACWCLEEQTLHENIRKILHKFCQPTPTVCDVNYLSSNAPPAASEWTALLRPLRGREPEGLFNLLSIVQEMYCRHDSNAVALLHIITQECLACDQVVLWWFHTSLLQSSNAPQVNLVHSIKPSVSATASSSGVSGSHAPTSQYSCATLFDGIVALWRLACLNPNLLDSDRCQLFNHLKAYHIRTVEKVFKILNDVQPATRRVTHSHNNAGPIGAQLNAGLGAAHPTPLPAVGNAAALAIRPAGIAAALFDVSAPFIRFDLDSFAGFRLALEVCGADDLWAPIAAASSYDCGGDSSDDALRDALNECWLSVRNTSRRSSFTTAVVAAKTTIRSKSHDASPSSASMPASKTSPIATAAAKSSRVSSLRPSSSLDSKTDKAETPTPRDDIDRLYMREQAAEDSAGSPIDPPTQLKTAVEIAEEALSFLRPVRDRVELLFARCEGLAAHGYSDDACRLAAHLARYLSAHPPNLLADDDGFHYGVAVDAGLPPTTTACAAVNSNAVPNVAQDRVLFSQQSKKKKATCLTLTESPNRSAAPTAAAATAPFDASADDPSQPTTAADLRRHSLENLRLSVLASSTLARVQFLFNVLYEDRTKHKLAFELGLCTLELLRRPAASRFLEVKLYHQETEIINCLKRLDLGHEEMNMLRDCASKFRNGYYATKCLSVLPLSLATYLFECLCGATTNAGRAIVCYHKMPKDDQLGFECAVAALSLKSNVAEADHPLLCEGIRRQKGDLSLSLLLRYKDDSSKVALIMDKLLDFEMHRMYKHHASNAIPFINGNAGHLSKGVVSCSASAVTTCAYICSAPLTSPAAVAASPTTSGDAASAGSSSLNSSRRSSVAGCYGTNNGTGGDMTPSTDGAASVDATFETSVADVLEELMLSEENRDEGNVEWSGQQPSNARRGRGGRNISNANNRGMTSRLQSDTSSTDSSSSGVSRDIGHVTTTAMTSAPIQSAMSNASRNNASLSTIASTSTTVANNARPSGSTAPKSVDPLNKNCYVKISRQRKYVTPSVPNQPSEAHAHFMSELAKRLLTEAGGNHSTAIFTTPQGGAQGNQPHNGGPHRALHLCAFQIGLYALGLHNKVTPNWLSRTYSSHVSWISGQAMEIGRMAIHVLIASWENHLTPTEVANLADKGSQSRDPAMVSASAELALSALSQAHALSQPDIQRALAQCREQNSHMLIKACLAVEQAAKDGGVYPDVLFKVAQQWNQMYVESLTAEQQATDNNVYNNAHQHQHHHHHHHQHHGHSDRLFGDPPLTTTTALSVVDVVATVSSPSAITALPPPSHFASHPPPSLASPVQPQQHLFPHRPPPSPFQHFGTIVDISQQPRTALIGPAPAAPNPAVFRRPPVVIPPNLPPPNNGSTVYAAFPMVGQPPPPINTPPLVQQRSNIAVQIIRTSPPFISLAHPAQQPTNHGAALPVFMASPGVMPILQQQQQHHQLVPFAPAYVPLINRMVIQGQVDVATSQSQLIGSLGPGAVNTTPSREHAGNSCYLYAAYRVGMLALETLGRRIHDERSYVKYAQNPPYGDDVKWLLGVSRKLGPAYVQQFCLAAVQAVVSPFVLWDLATETAAYFARTAAMQTAGATYIPPPPLQSSMHHVSGVWLTKALAHPCVQPLMQRCIQAFYAAAHQKLSHPRFMQSDAEEVCNLVKTAYTAFHHSNESFDAFMQSLRRQKACKKDLWNKLLNVLNVC